MEGTVAGSRKRLLGGCGAALLVALFHAGASPAQDSPADMEQLRQSARAGDAQALFSLADRYERGKSVEQDLSMTAALMRLAALRGYAEAQYRLGLALVGGVGVGMDLAAGYRWLSLAIAAAGDGKVGLVARPLRDAIAPLMTEPQIAQARQGVAGFKAMAGPAVIPKPAELSGSSDLAADRPSIERLRRIVGTTNCGPTRITRSKAGRLRVEGFVQGRRHAQAMGSAAAAYIKQYAIAVNFTELGPEICSVMNMIGRHRDKLDEDLQLYLRDEKGQVRDRFPQGSYLVVNMSALPASRYITIDYFAHDGTVLHMFPSNPGGDNLVRAGRPLVLGDPAERGPAWQIMPPFGKDLVVVFVSRRRLYSGARPGVEDSRGYLEFLARRLSKITSDDMIGIQYRVLTTTDGNI